MEPELPRTEWELDERMPRFDDMREFEVWMRNGCVRTVRRVGNRSTWITAGTLIFTDFADPLSNLICDESYVMGWRYNGKPAPELPTYPGAWSNFAARLLSPPYNPAEHSAAYPGF